MSTVTRYERSIDLTVISATGLKKVKTFGKQVSYVVAYVNSRQKQATKRDTTGGLDPVWNSKMTLTADEDLIQQGRANITLEIYSHGTFGDKIIGTARVPLGDLVKESKTKVGPQYLMFEVQRPSGSAKGTLNVSVSIGEKRSYEVPAASQYRAASSNIPVGYPAAQQYGGSQFNSPYASQPPQQAYYPPQQGYYPPQQGYYQQQPAYYQQQQQGRRQGFGGGRLGGGGGFGGAGLGLGAGLLGGLLVGDLIGDGFGDGGDGGDGGGFGGDGGGDGGFF